MSTPITIQEHIDALLREDKCRKNWFVIYYDPAYGYAKTVQFDTEKLAHGFYDDLKSEGRKPRMFFRDTTIVTVPVRSL